MERSKKDKLKNHCKYKTFQNVMKSINVLSTFLVSKRKKKNSLYETSFKPTPLSKQNLVNVVLKKE